MPDWTRYLREHVSLPLMEQHRDERAIQEMADHLQDLYDEARSRGLSQEDAEALVLRWIGNPERAAEDLIGVEPHHVRARVDRWLQDHEERLGAGGGYRAFLSDGIRDLRLGLRSLGRRPLFTAVVVVVLALGIGATSAIFTLVNAVVLAPLPFPDAGRLVAIHHLAPEKGFADWGECAAWHYTYEDESRVFDALGMYTPRRASVVGEGAPESVPVLAVTNGVLAALGVTPVTGRRFAPVDDDPEAPATVMLGYGYWQRRYGGDPDVVGRTIQVDGTPRQIIGVAPPEVRILGPNPALLLPLRFPRAGLSVGNFGFGSVGRLKDGVTLEQADADLNRVLPLAWEKFPGGPVASSSGSSHYVAEVHTLKADVVGSIARTLWILMAGVAIVLLIACANVAGLYLVRAEDKEGEMAVRTAMGASGRRIGWEYLKESLLLGLTGGVLGLILAQVGLRSILASAPTSLPRVDEIHLNGEVLLVTLALSLGSGLFFGLIPALRSARESLVDVLKDGGRNGVRSRRPFRAQRSLAVGQMALAVVLLVASGLALRSVANLRSVDPGFRAPNDVLAFRLNISSSDVRSSSAVAATYEAIVRRIQEIPGVSSAGYGTAIPMDGAKNLNPFYVRGRDAGGHMLTRRHKWITPGYLETLRIPLVAGRSFTWDDIHNRAAVAMLSERLAREVFGSPEAALGQFIAARPDPPVWKEVVGVVKDVREDGMDQDPPDLVYWPEVTLGFWEGDAPDDVLTWRDAGIVVRSDRVGTPGFVKDVERAVWEVRPSLPLQQVRTLPQLMSASMARATFTTILLGIAAAVALILGLVGVYGVIAYTVSRRTRELGMRIALGAAHGRVLRMVVRQGLTLATMGVAVGLAVAFVVTRSMSSMLFGVSPADPVTYAAVAAGLMGVALLASYLPARRAAGVDPAVALRAE